MQLHKLVNKEILHSPRR